MNNRLAVSYERQLTHLRRHPFTSDIDLNGITRGKALG
jgi:hypothetical protein